MPSSDIETRKQGLWGESLQLPPQLRISFTSLVKILARTSYPMLSVFINNSAEMMAYSGELVPISGLHKGKVEH